MEDIIDTHTHKRDREDISIINISLTEPLQNLPKYFSAGIHPWHINKVSITELQTLLSLFSTLNGLVAIGEAGIDKLITTDLQLQTDIFRKQAIIADQLNLPLIIHCVKAQQEIIAVKKEIKPKNTWIVHGFRGKKEQAEQLIKAGIMMSFGLFYNEEAIKCVSDDNLLIETDDCDTDIMSIAEKVAQSRGVDKEHIISTVSSNIKRLFLNTNDCKLYKE